MLHGLAEANRVHGTRFPTDGSKSNLVLGDLSFPITDCLMFDSASKKVAVLSHGRFELHDLDYIRDWELRWVDTPVGSKIRRSKFRMHIGTSDVNRPSLEVFIDKERDAEDWSHRLPLLVRG